VNPFDYDPFHDAYVTDTVSSDDFVRYFSSILVEDAGPMFMPGNVVLKGTQGSGKSMLLLLLEPSIRIAYHRAAKNKPESHLKFPVPAKYRNFIAARVNLNKSGLLDVAQTLKASPSTEDLKDLTRSFCDLFNYWMLRGLLESLVMAEENKEAFDNAVQKEFFDTFAESFAKSECWFGAFEGVVKFDQLQAAILKRIISYRKWSNGNEELPADIITSRSSMGVPLSQAANHLKTSGVIPKDANVFYIIDQMEALWTSRDGKNGFGSLFRKEIHEMLGRRDGSASFRIGARRYDWAKGGDVSMRDGRQLEEGRDYEIIDIDSLLRKGEHSRNWKFKRFAEEVFQRRIAVSLGDLSGTAYEPMQSLESFFGRSPDSQEWLEALLRNPPSDYQKLLRLDKQWPKDWVDLIESIYHRKIDHLKENTSDNYPYDPLNALFLTAWGLQTGGKRNQPPRREQDSPPPSSPTDQPWSTEKRWWRKERMPQALLQLTANHSQRLKWWGDRHILALSGSNILWFLWICRETWDHWRRQGDLSLFKTDKRTKCLRVVPAFTQASAIDSVSNKIHDSLGRQPGCPAGDLRIRFLDEVASWLRNKMVSDKAMSNPGHNGFSLTRDELASSPELQQLLEEAVGWGDLYEVPHTSKAKREKFRNPRLKYYLNPALSPHYQLPEAHTKEPVYNALEQLKEMALKSKAIVFSQEVKEVTKISYPESDGQGQLPLN
jgi:hypothetical protein